MVGAYKSAGLHRLLGNRYRDTARGRHRLRPAGIASSASGCAVEGSRARPCSPPSASRWCWISLRTHLTPDPRGVPTQLPDWRIQIGGGTISGADILIAASGHQRARLYVFWFHQTGWAVRATALDGDAASNAGVDVNKVNSAVFAIARRSAASAACWWACINNSIDPTWAFRPPQGIVGR